MGKRREGREAAVQFLYQFDVNRIPVDEALTGFLGAADRSGQGRDNSQDAPFYRGADPRSGGASQGHR